ncbi:MAG: hypothetical protein DRJ66_03290 [Thermoprotei archaeon]|nr:MAG: hypothetical protein DRJ66_03290 [Thermoprotei archaeon]
MAFRINQVYNCQRAFDLQKEIASRLSKYYGITVHVVQGLTFTRFEVYDENERCILLTNPVYFAEGMMPSLPKHRVVKQ